MHIYLCLYTFVLSCYNRFNCNTSKLATNYTFRLQCGEVPEEWLAFEKSTVAVLYGCDVHINYLLVDRMPGRRSCSLANWISGIILRVQVRIIFLKFYSKRYLNLLNG